MPESSIFDTATNRLQYYMLTIVFLVVTVVLASYGEVFDNIFTYFWDSVFLLLFIWLGYLLTFKVCMMNQAGKKLSAWLLTFFYFYTVFVIFSDGHGATAHSEGIFEKLLLIPATFYYFTKSIFLPLIFLGVALLHNALAYVVCQPCREDL